MKPLLHIILPLLLALPSVAMADSALPSLEQKGSLLSAHRTRLEARLSGQVQRIRRLKAQQPGVRRDFQLAAALRQNQQLAQKLSQLQQQLRTVHNQLITAYGRAITASTDHARITELKRKLARLAGNRPAPDSIVTRVKSGPLDSSEDLEEKADLLDDSREKIRRQLTRIQRRITLLQHQMRLRRHGKAADDSPFDESSTGRGSRPNSTRKTSTDSNSPQGALGATGSSKRPGPAPPKSSYGTGTPTNRGGTEGGFTDDPASAFGTSQVPGSMQDVLDPAVLKELGGSASIKGGGLKARLEALQRASQKLKQMSGTLSKQSHSLRRKAWGIRPPAGHIKK